MPNAMFALSVEPELTVSAANKLKNRWRLTPELDLALSKAS